jgi:putative hemolysin
MAARRSLHRLAPACGEPESEKTDFDVVWARDEEDVRQAQQLRYRVFVGEMGAQLSPPTGSPPGHDIDVFDPFCEHLLS